VAPVAADAFVVEAIEEAARRSGRPWCRMSSGAGHDAQILARAVPAGMIFVPSRGGVSHSPEERSDPDHLVAGAQALLDALLVLDERSGTW
jgi:N-carbamoyl-L-amino-acid hydrolase